MNDNADAIRKLIEAFLTERRDRKLETVKENDAQKRKQIAESYRRESWLEKASLRVSQIKLATHALKFTHPDAKGTNVYYQPNDSLPEPLVGSGDHKLVGDVVGNAAQLDVYQFLKLEVNGETLLQRIQRGDKATVDALSDDPDRAEAWCNTLASITQQDGPPTSHTLAKQLYFPLADGSYHLISPLYPTSLVHEVYAQITHDRYSQDTKTARDARRKGLRHDSGYREFLKLAVREFGGSNPQNISQLNAERGGMGYLLPSCPPHWTSQPIKLPLGAISLFSNWLLRRGRLRRQTHGLRKFLEKVPTETTNVHIRETRARYLANIIDEVLLVATQIQHQPPGWSLESGCKLDKAEALWLDPGRTESDESFSQERKDSDWPVQVSHRFGNWLNAIVRSDRLPLGDAEHSRWKNALRRELKAVERGLDDER